MLAGVRPEEVAEWRAGPVEPAAALTFARQRRRAVAGRRARDRRGQARRGARRPRRRAGRRPGRADLAGGPQGAGRGAQPRARPGLADGDRHRRRCRWAARRRSSRSTPSSPRPGASPRWTSSPAGRCAPSCSWARAAPRRSPAPAPRRSRTSAPSSRTSGRTGPSVGRLAVRPSPDERPRRRRTTQGAMWRPNQAASRTTRRCARGPRPAGGSGSAQAPSAPGSASASAIAAAMRAWPSGLACSRSGAHSRGSAIAAALQVGEARAVAGADLAQVLVVGQRAAARERASGMIAAGSG